MNNLKKKNHNILPQEAADDYLRNVLGESEETIKSLGEKPSFKTKAHKLFNDTVATILGIVVMLGIFAIQSAIFVLMLIVGLAVLKFIGTILSFIFHII